MPGWGDLLAEVNDELQQLPANQAGPALDAKRVGYLQKLQATTGRPVFLYATDWLSGGAPPELTSISLEDIHGLMRFHETSTSSARRHPPQPWRAGRSHRLNRPLPA
jgi:hypothetical protein